MRRLALSLALGLLLAGLPSSLALAAAVVTVTQSCRVDLDPVHPGQTQTATAVIKNVGNSKVTLAEVALGLQDPSNAWKANYDSRFNYTLTPGRTLTLSGSYSFAAGDPLGSWHCYAGWRTGSTWSWGGVTYFTVQAATSGGGVPMPVGDLPGWHQSFADDFTANVPTGSFPAAVSDRWFAYPDGWMDGSGGTYMPSKVLSQHDSLLDYYVHTENGVHMVSAPEPKLAAGPHDYGAGLSAGRYAVRFRADPVPCYKTAWLLWPDSEVWPGDGEIDFPEGYLDGTISGFMHRMNGTSPGDADGWATSTTYVAWHTAVIEWRPDLQDLKLYLDDVLIGHSTARVPSTPMHWVLQTQVSDSGCVPAPTAAGHVLVDWVSVYNPA